MTSAPSSEEERPTFNRQVDGSNPSERTNADARFEAKMGNTRWAKGAARAYRKHALQLVDQLNEAHANKGSVVEILRDCEAYFSERSQEWKAEQGGACNLEAVMRDRVRDAIDLVLGKPQESDSSGSAL